MKKVISFTLVFTALLSLVFASVSCNNQSDPDRPTLSIYPVGTVDIPVGGGSATITVTTNQPAWDAVSDLEWCVVEQAANSFTVSAAANTGEEPMPEATITVTAGEGEGKVTRTLKVRQAGTGVERLDRDGTANSYIVSGGAETYSFDATTVGNGNAGIINPAFHTSSATIAPVSAKLLWQDYYNDGQGLITSVSLVDGRVEFKVLSTGTPSGNAVIAVCDESGKILWSWHIWIPAVEVEGLPVETGYSVMNLNLGATTNEVADPKSYGMLYQWGRKDPLPAAATLTGTTSTISAPMYDMEGNEVKITNSSWSNSTNNTLLYSIANPTVCLSSYSYYSTSRDWLAPGTSIDALWGNPEGYAKDENNNFINKGVKSLYDPCPVGWRVPPADVFRKFTTSGGYAWADPEGGVPDFNIVDRNGDGSKSIEDYEYGWIFSLGAGVGSYFPAAARFDGSYAMLMGSMSGLWGSYWGNAPYDSSLGIPNAGFCVLSFQTKDQGGNTAITASPSGGSGRADAYSIRCIREN